MDEPSYDAVIPPEIRYADISANAKILYGEIRALSNTEGYCWAGDRYFSEIYDCSKRSIRNWIEELEKLGVIVRDTDKSRDEHKRRIYITPNRKKYSADKGKNIPNPTNVNNDTSNNDSSTNVEQAPALDGEFVPPEENQQETPAHVRAANSESPHQAIADINRLDSTNEKSHYLSKLFLELFGDEHERFGPKNLHGRICGVKNSAKAFSDEPYDWLVRQFFRIKNDEEFDAPTDTAKQQLPFRVHHYLQKVVSDKADAERLPDLEPEDSVTEETKKRLVSEGKYEDQDFQRFKVNADPNQESFLYKP